MAVELHADVLVVGGGLGGVAAALAALRRGRSVVLTEETDWLGGQLTSQGVPPDEHPWIERFGCTASYRQLREGVRDYYRRWYPLAPQARSDPHLNPGRGRVSKLCHEPRVAVAVLEGMLSPHVASRRLRILLEHRPLSAELDGSAVRAVTLAGDGGSVRVTADFVLDATELGDLLPLTGTDYVTGFESRAETGEPSAPAEAQPQNMQAFSWVFAIEHDEGHDHTIDRPADYDMWRAYQPTFWPARLLSLTSPHPRTLETVERSFVPNAAADGVIADQSQDPGDLELWAFRRILARESFAPGFLESDVTIVNWPMIDYIPGSIIDVPDDEKRLHLAGSRELSLSMLYWLQTEAPRPDGGLGWPGLRMRGDVMGTDDGFAKAPYIRESRRLRARKTITEQDISLDLRGSHRAVDYPDTVGIGMYRLDLHPSTGGDNYIDVASTPFQIPLGALLSPTRDNLFAAGKNLGTTHITNGCYRLHPVEWNVGEAAGALAAHCLNNGYRAVDVYEDSGLLREFQDDLLADGFELHWPDLAEVKGY